MFGEVFYIIDPNTMVLGLLFLIFFVLTQFALNKALRDKGISIVIAFCVSLLAVYGLGRSNWDLSSAVFRLGISENIFYMIVPWIALGLLFLASFRKDPLTGKKRFRVSAFLFLLGVLLIFASFFVYEQAIVMIAGIVLIIFSFLLWLRRRKRWNFQGLKKNFPVDNQSSQHNLAGKAYLISAAKQFRSWAKNQPNPKFVGSWAKFINWIGRGKMNEAQLCQKYGVSKSEFVAIFQKYGMV